MSDSERERKMVREVEREREVEDMYSVGSRTLKERH